MIYAIELAERNQDFSILATTKDRELAVSIAQALWNDYRGVKGVVRVTVKSLPYWQNGRMTFHPLAFP